MKKVWLLLIILFCSSTRLIFSQEGEYWGIASQIYYDRFYDRTFDLNFKINGARASGMGGAYRAIAEDATALSLNPAGITQLQNFTLSAIGQFDFDSREYQEPKNIGMKVISEIKPFFSLNSFSLALPVSIGPRQIVAGFTYHSFDPMKKYIDDTHYYYGGGRISEIKDISGGRYTYSPTIAVEIIPKFSFGMTYNFILGESNYDLKIRSPYAEKRLYFRFKDKEKYSGSFMDLGFLFYPIKWFSIGLTFTPSWNYSIEEKLESFTTSQYSSERAIWAKTSWSSNL